MKTGKFSYTKFSYAFGLALIMLFSCEREVLNSTPLATFNNNPEVFIDSFSPGLEYYPYSGSFAEALSIDTDAYDGGASMRFDIPNVGDPAGAYSGAIFRDDNSGRDLTGNDALTFWAKSSQGGVSVLFGFGQDFFGDKYAVGTVYQLTTNWRKYVVPIPDASKLLEEDGLFWYAAGPVDGAGYSIWVDEIMYESLGTIAQPRPVIVGGQDQSIQSFAGSSFPIEGLIETFNLGNGQDQIVSVAAGYYEFTSSNPGTATVDEFGIVTVVGTGATVITATLNGMEAEGSLSVLSLGDFTPAPEPSQAPGDVISIFSDAYDNVPVDFYNGYWQFSTTQGQDDIDIDGDNIINYTDLNFVGIQFAQPTINASEMTNFRLDLFVQDQLDPGDFFRIVLVDFGPDNVFGGGNDVSAELTFNSPTLVNDEWISLDIPLSSFPGINSLSNFAQIVLVSDATIPNVYVDNIYLYKLPTDPTDAAPTPTEPEANVISLFSDAYTDVPVDTWRTDWSAGATVLEDIDVAGNPTKKYTNLGFVGIETVSTTVDASGMTHFHIDVWSPDFTTFNIKLVDFGADNAFDGGDDSEHEISISGLPQGEWVSLDIPLSDFTGLTSTSNIAQYILVGFPYEVTDVFIDNVYFHN